MYAVVILLCLNATIHSQVSRKTIMHNLNHKRASGRWRSIYILMIQIQHACAVVIKIKIMFCRFSQQLEGNKILYILSGRFKNYIAKSSCTSEIVVFWHKDYMSLFKSMGRRQKKTIMRRFKYWYVVSYLQFLNTIRSLRSCDSYLLFRLGLYWPIWWLFH